MNHASKIAIDDTLLKTIRKLLLVWGMQNFQNYPWRFTRDPYHILMAEIILHRTRAAQSTAIYRSLVSEYPTLSDLAQASPTRVKELLRGAGLQWRTQMLLDMVKIISEKYEGKIPRDRDILLSLPGVGDYITSAVRCFAWGHPDSILDTNTVRVTGRVFGIPVTDSTRRSNKMKELMNHLVPRDKPGEFNFALLDLGALICHPKGPECNRCPLSDSCHYKKELKSL